MINNIIGWIATGLTCLSFGVNGESRIRLINGIACLVWISYGIQSNQYPIIAVNGIVLVMHLKFFWHELDNINKINYSTKSSAKNNNKRDKQITKP